MGHQGSGRARRDAANRAMQGWHSQRLLGNGEVGDPIIKDKNAISLQKREKQIKNIGLLKRKKPSSLDRSAKAARTIMKVPKPQIEADVADVGPPADWVKINVQRT
ncbi:At-rich interactive domain-containing protein, partial [Thalictrum thalictroides]